MTGPQPFVFDESSEAKRYAPATERNRHVITEKLRPILPPSGMVLEIASGTGEHIVHFARVFPNLKWQPSDPDPAALASIDEWSDESGLFNVMPPIQLDASLDWDVTTADAVLCINMAHISPWEATLGLMRNAARILPPNAPLYLYGPYRQGGVAASDSNDSFHDSLKARNPSWGLRYVEDITEAAVINGLQLDAVIEMPANNLSLIFRS